MSLSQPNDQFGPDHEAPTPLKGDGAIAYLQLQYARISEFETRRSDFTNITIGASAVALALVATESGSATRTVVTTLVAIVNLLALGHTERMSEQIGIHASRSRELLARIDPELDLIRQRLPTPRHRSVHSGRSYQHMLHITFVIGSVALAMAG